MEVHESDPVNRSAWAHRGIRPSRKGCALSTYLFARPLTPVHRALGAAIGGAVARAITEPSTSDELLSPGSSERIRRLALEDVESTDHTDFEQLLETGLAASNTAPNDVEFVGMSVGAAVGVQRIPSRLTRGLLGGLGRPDRLRRLTSLAHKAIGIPERPETPPEQARGPLEVHSDGLYAANLAGAARAPSTMAIVSLCRGAGLLDDRPVRHELYLLDEPDPEHNPSLHHVVTDAVMTIDEFLAHGHQVVVHCHGGRSRTALVLKAWYMRRHQADHTQANRWLTTQWSLTSDWNDRFTDFLDHDWSNR